MRDVRWQELELLNEAGLTAYEKKALVTLMVFGVADAGTLCREGDIPTSKTLLRDGEVGADGTRPGPADPSKAVRRAAEADAVADRLTELARARAERFASRAPELQRALAALPRRLRGRRAPSPTWHSASRATSSDT